MPDTIDKRQVLVAGTYTLSDAYPNVRYRIKALEQHPCLHITEVRISSSTRIKYASRRSRKLSLLWMAVSQLHRSARCIAAIIRHRQVNTLYLPYPAVPLLFLLSFVPPKWLPQRIVADAFISLYDTIIIDRELLAAGSFIARLLWKMERRALLTATITLTDTPENSTYLADLLDLPVSSLQDLPLSINESHFNDSGLMARTTVSGNSVFKVLFVGTLVPLHRIDLILDAITILRPQRTIEFTFIGDGQQSHLLDSFLKLAAYDTAKVKVRWVRAWQSSADIEHYVRETNLCLGIMGNEGKSSRVWPFKNYLYMASGKALVTAETTVSIRLRALVDYPAFITINVADPHDLAHCVLTCAEDSGFPGELPANAARFFNEKLSLNAIQDRLFTLVTGEAAAPGKELSIE